MEYITINDLDLQDTLNKDDYLVTGKDDLKKVSIGKLLEIVTTDSTLTVSGKPADAKATGDRLAKLESKMKDDLATKLGLYIDADGDLCQKEV